MVVKFRGRRELSAPHRDQLSRLVLEFFGCHFDGNVFVGRIDSADPVAR